MTYHRVCRKSITTGATSVAGTAYPSEEPKFSPDFSGVRVTRSLVFCVMFCTSLFVLLQFPFCGHSIVRSSIYGFWLPLWYLQTFLYTWIRCLSFCTFSFGHCVVCSSSIYGLWCSKCILETDWNIFVSIHTPYSLSLWGRRFPDCMVVRFITTYAISAYHHLFCEFEYRTGEVYSIQHYAIKFVSDLLQAGGYLRILRFRPQIKLTATI